MGKLASRLALVAVGIGLGVAAAELLVRVAGPDIQVVFRDSVAPSDDPVLGYALRPGAPDGTRRISTQGLRDRDFAVPKPPGVVRIEVIGDSIAYGYGSEQDETFPKQLEALFGVCADGAGPRVEVPNLGVSGYNAVQVAARLRAVGLALEPDAVVYGYSLNDPQDYSIEAEALDALRDAFEQGTGTGLGRWLSHSRLYLLARKVGFEGMKQEALRARKLVDPGWHAARSGSQQEYYRSLHRDGRSAERLRRGLDEIAAIASERGLPVLVAIFPVLGKRVGASGHDGTPVKALADVHELVASLAVERGFAALDLLPAYDRGGRRFWLDFMHPDPSGHRIAAEAIRDWMCANAWPPGVALRCACPPR